MLLLNRPGSPVGGIRIACAVAIIGASIVWATSAEAQSRRPDTRNMTCAQAQSMVSQRGAVVMSTGTHTFNRFVHSMRYCAGSEALFNAFVPTKDNRKCLLRYCDYRMPIFD